MTELSEIENEGIWAEGHRAFDMGKPEHSNPHRPGSIENEIWLGGWGNGYQKEQQVVRQRTSAKGERLFNRLRNTARKDDLELLNYPRR